MFFRLRRQRASFWGVSERCRSNGSRDMAVFVKTFYFCPRSKFDFGAPPVFVFVFVCAYLYLYLYLCICICICLCVCVCDHDHLLSWFNFDENPFLRLSLTSHDNSGVSWGNQPFLGDGTSETLSEGIPGQLFDSPCPQNCWIGPKRTKKFALLS